MLQQIESFKEEMQILQQEKEEAIRLEKETARQQLEEQHRQLAFLHAERARARRGCHGRRGMRRIACELSNL
jgi:hypothetical protein